MRVRRCTAEPQSNLRQRKRHIVAFLCKASARASARSSPSIGATARVAAWRAACSAPALALVCQLFLASPLLRSPCTVGRNRGHHDLGCPPGPRFRPSVATSRASAPLPSRWPRRRARRLGRPRRKALRFQFRKSESPAGGRRSRWDGPIGPQKGTTRSLPDPYLGADLRTGRCGSSHRPVRVITQAGAPCHTSPCSQLH